MESVEWKPNPSSVHPLQCAEVAIVVYGSLVMNVMGNCRSLWWTFVLLILLLLCCKVQEATNYTTNKTLSTSLPLLWIVFPKERLLTFVDSFSLSVRFDKHLDSTRLFLGLTLDGNRAVRLPSNSAPLGNPTKHSFSQSVIPWVAGLMVIASILLE